MESPIAPCPAFGWFPRSRHTSRLPSVEAAVTAQEGEMKQIGDQAVVLGAGMAGLLAARVLADAYRRVTVVERDPLPQMPANRKGVPQGRHAHLLVPRGAQILDELFPGLLGELVAEGAPMIGDYAELRFAPGGHLLRDRKSTRLNSSHVEISYAVFCLKKKKKNQMGVLFHKKKKKEKNKEI